MESDSWSDSDVTDVQSSDEEDFEDEPGPSGHIPSPLESAVLISGKFCDTPTCCGIHKPEYKNDDYLSEIRIIFAENPNDDEFSCFYATASIMMFRMANSDSVKFLRKKFAHLINYQRLITAREPELTMERLVTTATMNEEVKELPEEKFTNWESMALNGGAPRIFNYLLSYVLNELVYVLDLSTNQWREYDLTNTDLEFHSNLVKEYKPLHPFGPPFMIAEHLEMENGELLRTHVAPIIHEEFDDGSRNGGFYKMPIDIYVKFMTHPTMIEVGCNFKFHSSYTDKLDAINC